ncbi:MAG: hypothetical protein RR386_06480 [Bacteroidaceae bacterium]
MENNFFIVYFRLDEENYSSAKYTSKEKAQKEAKRLANSLNKEVFVLESNLVEMPDKEDVKINSYEDSLEYLGRESGECVHRMVDKHTKAITAMYKLIVIAEAWNKADEFVPDFDNTNQYKWFPRFKKQGAAGFVFANTINTATYAYAYIGSRLCFKNRKLAEYAITQFKSLYEEYLLIK